MAQLFFHHGTMNSSKTAQLIMAEFAYKSQDKPVFVCKPDTDTRWTTGTIQSRAVSNTLDCLIISKDNNIKDMIINHMETNGEIYAVLVDEAQFLTTEHVLQLTEIVDELDIPVLCYGLKNSAIKGEFFEGSRALLYYAESIKEIKSVCSMPCCNKKATMNLRVKDGKPIYEGEVVVIGDVGADNVAEYYVPTCREHYFNPPMEALEELK